MSYTSVGAPTEFNGTNEELGGDSSTFLPWPDLVASIREHICL